MKDIQICLFNTAERRLPIAFGNVIQLSNINPAHFDRLILKIFCYRCHEANWKKQMEHSKIPFHIYAMPSPGETPGYTGYDYKERTRICMESDQKYSIRIDDDLFISTPLWNFMLDTIDEVLSQEMVHAYSPLFSTAVPHIDLFTDDFLSATDKDQIESIYKKDGVPATPWFPYDDYVHVQKIIESMDKWDKNLFWKEVLNHRTVYQTLHPIKFSSDANIFLTDRILSNFDKILNEQEYECVAIAGMPNSHWTCTRTANWKRAFAKFGGPHDAWDEMPMQCNERKYGMSSVFIKRGFAVHPCHASVPNREKIDEQYASFISKLGDTK